MLILQAPHLVIDGTFRTSLNLYILYRRAEEGAGFDRLEDRTEADETTHPPRQKKWLDYDRLLNAVNVIDAYDGCE